MTTHLTFEQIIASPDDLDAAQAVANHFYEQGRLSLGDLPERHRSMILRKAERRGVSLPADHPVHVQLWYQGRGQLNASGRLIPGSVGPDIHTFRFRTEIAA
jgi:hypothetical protein